MRFASALVLALALGAPVAAQTTWIVDAQNGPGTHFTDIPPAIAAAADGDTIIVRTGTYAAFSTGKGLTILGEGFVDVREPGFVFANPPIEVTGLPQGKTFVAVNLRPWLPSLASEAVNLEGNAGRVHLQDFWIPLIGFPVPRNAAIRIEDCSSVTITGGLFAGHPGMYALRSTVSVSGATIEGGPACGSLRCSNLGPGTGIWGALSDIHLSRTTVRGGDGGLWNLAAQGRSALELNATDLIVTGDASTVIEAGTWTGAPPLPAIFAFAGTVQLDTQVVVTGAQGGPQVGGGGGYTVVRRRIVSLTGSGGPLGGSLDAELVSPAGDSFWLVAGFPAAPIPTPFGELHLSPLLIVLLGSGVQGPSETFSWTAPIPNNAALRGGVIGLQAANLYAATQTVEYSNMVTVVIE